MTDGEHPKSYADGEGGNPTVLEKLVSGLERTARSRRDSKPLERDLVQEIASIRTEIASLRKTVARLKSNRILFRRLNDLKDGIIMQRNDEMVAETWNEAVRLIVLKGEGGGAVIEYPAYFEKEGGVRLAIEKRLDEIEVYLKTAERKLDFHQLQLEGFEERLAEARKGEEEAVTYDFTAQRPDTDDTEAYGKRWNDLTFRLRELMEQELRSGSGQTSQKECAELDRTIDDLQSEVDCLDDALKGDDAQPLLDDEEKLKRERLDVEGTDAVEKALQEYRDEVSDMRKNEVAALQARLDSAESDVVQVEARVVEKRREADQKGEEVQKLEDEVRALRKEEETLKVRLRALLQRQLDDLG
jgi:chromosome segregation ATPase